MFSNNGRSTGKRNVLSFLSESGPGKTSALMHNSRVLTANLPQFRTVLAHPSPGIFPSVPKKPTAAERTRGSMQNLRTGPTRNTSSREVYQRFNESVEDLRPPNRTLSQYNAIVQKLGSGKKDPASTRELLGIGINPEDTTVTCPGLVQSKGELYRTSYISEENWKLKARVGLDLLDMAAPESFPLRKTREAELRMLTTEGGPRAQRPCTDLRKAELAELNKKRSEIVSQNAFTKRKRRAIKRGMAETAQEARVAVSKSLKDLKEQHKAGLAVSNPEMRHRRFVRKTALRASLFVPYFITSIEHRISAMPGSFYDSAAERKSRAVLINLAGEQDVASPEQLRKVNVKNFMKELKPALNSNEGKLIPGTTLNRIGENVQPTEVIAVLPKAYGYGDTVPRGISKDEYTEGLSFYKLDKQRLQSVVHDFEGKEEVSLSTLKDALAKAGSKVDEEAEQKRCEDLVEQEQIEHDGVGIETKEEDKDQCEYVPETNVNVPHANPSEEQPSAVNSKQEETSFVPLKIESQPKPQVHLRPVPVPTHHKSHSQSMSTKRADEKASEDTGRVVTHPKEHKRQISALVQPQAMVAIPEAEKMPDATEKSSVEVSEVNNNKLLEEEQSLPEEKKESRSGQVEAAVPRIASVLTESQSQSLDKPDEALHPKEVTESKTQQFIAKEAETKVQEKEEESTGKVNPSVEEVPVEAREERMEGNDTVQTVERTVPIPQKKGAKKKPEKKTKNPNNKKSAAKSKAASTKPTVKAPARKKKNKTGSTAKKEEPSQPASEIVPKLPLADLPKESPEPSPVQPPTHMLEGEKPASSSKQRKASISSAKKAPNASAAPVPQSNEIPAESTAGAMTTPSVVPMKKLPQRTSHLSPRPSPVQSAQPQSSPEPQSAEPKKESAEYIAGKVKSEAQSPSRTKPFQRISSHRRMVLRSTFGEEGGMTPGCDQSPAVGDLLGFVSPTNEKGRNQANGVSTFSRLAAAATDGITQAATQVQDPGCESKDNAENAEEEVGEEEEEADEPEPDTEEHGRTKKNAKAGLKKTVDMIKGTATESAKPPVAVNRLGKKGREASPRPTEKPASKSGSPLHINLQPVAATEVRQAPMLPGSTASAVTTKRAGGTSSWRRNQSDDEEKLWADAYAKMMEQNERNNEEKKRLEAEARMREKEAQEGTSEEMQARAKEKEWEETISALSDPNKAVELMRQRMDNPKRLEMLMEKLGRNDDMRNIILQRQQQDLEAMQDCSSALWGFFTETQFPEFHKTKLENGSKFTQTVSFAQVPPDTDRSLPPSREQSKKKKPANSKSTKRLGTGSLTSNNRVSADYLYRLRGGDKALAKAIEEVSGGYVSYNNDADGRELDDKARLELFSTHLLIAQHVLNSRQQRLKQLSNLHEEFLTSTGMSPATSAKTEARRVVGSRGDWTQSFGPGKSRRYKVNMDVLKHRDGMSVLEVMDRRYQILLDGKGKGTKNQNHLL